MGADKSCTAKNWLIVILFVLIAGFFTWSGNCLERQEDELARRKAAIQRDMAVALEAERAWQVEEFARQLQKKKGQEWIKRNLKNI